MPVIARLDGIVIRMYLSQSEHNPPHIHAIHGDDMVAMDIRTGKVLDGAFPPKDVARLREWVREHRDELLCIWDTQEFARIDSSR